MTVVTPVFDESGATVLFCLAARGYHADIGGTIPGSMPPDSRTMAEEGILLEDFLLVRGVAATKPPCWNSWKAGRGQPAIRPT